MLVEISVFFANLVLIIFGIVASVECPETFAENSVDVFCFPDILVFSHDHNIGFDQAAFEAGCLSEKPLDHFGVILRKHGRNRVPFGGEFKQGKVIIVLP